MVFLYVLIIGLPQFKTTWSDHTGKHNSPAVSFQIPHFRPIDSPKRHQTVMVEETKRLRTTDELFASYYSKGPYLFAVEFSAWEMMTFWGNSAEENAGKHKQDPECDPTRT